MRKKIKILTIAGARPNFVKIAPLFKEFKKYKVIKPILVHTGQHYNREMSQSFFQELGIPKPNYNLKAGSGTQAEQTGKIMIKFERVCLKEKPDIVIVVGDVNSTLAGALVAAKLRIPLAHIEAGLRSFDREMPEETNRVLVDQIADYLFVSEPSAIKNLIKEGISKKKIFFVGNIMIDSLKNQKFHLPKFSLKTWVGKKIKNKKHKLKILKQLNLKPKEYAVLTLHRPENVDNKKIFNRIVETLGEIQKKIKVIWSIHPRTEKQIKKFKLNSRLRKLKNIIPIKPIGYLEMLNLTANCKFIMTDSGGVQEESTVLGVPCLTLRKNTERPITVEVGTNTVVGTNKNKILKEVNKILAGKGKEGKIPRYWDGQTAKRIIKVLVKNQTYVSKI